MLQRFLLFWLLLLSLVAFYFDRIPLAWDPFLKTADYLWYLIAITMFAIGWMLPRDEVDLTIRRWPLVLLGTTIQFATMPLLAFCIGKLFQFEGEMLTGIIIVGCVPGAMASNVLTLIARGNVSYSLSLTTSATLLSPLVVPLTLYLALGTKVSFPTLLVATRLLWAVVVPVVLGHLLGRYKPHWESHARRIGPVVANLAILWIIAVVVAKSRQKLVDLDGLILLALLLINLLGYLVGYYSGSLLKLPEPMRRALTLEIGMQNAGLGATLATEFFGASTAIPAALYTFGCMFTGTILARLWAAATEKASQDALSEQSAEEP